MGFTVAEFSNASRETQRTPSKHFLLLLMSISVISFILLYILGEKNIILARQFFNILGPFCTFILINSLALYLLFDEISADYFLTIYLFTFITSILGIFTALSLNTRIVNILSIIALDPAIITNPSYLIFIEIVLVSFCVPIVEEFAKAYALLIIGRQIGVKISENREQRLISRPKVFILLAIVSGSTFNMLETFWYSWNVGAIDEIRNTDQWRTISGQVILRSINPLHTFGTLLVAYAIILSLNNKTGNIISRIDIRTIFSGFIFAVLAHGLWNGIATLSYYSPDTFKWISLLHIEIPLVMLELIAISIGGIALILFWANRYEFSICEICQNFHDSSLRHDTAVQNLHLLNSNNTNPPQFQCRNCGSPKEDETCKLCGTPEVFMCTNCNYPLPVYAHQCWRCNVPVENVFNTILQFPDNKFNLFLKSYPVLMLGLFLPQTLSTVLAFVQGQIQGETKAPNQLLLYLIISTTLGMATYFALNEKYKSLGIILGKYLLGLTMLLLDLLFFVLVSFLWVAFRNAAIAGTFLSSLLMLILAIGFAYIPYYLLQPTTILWRVE